MQKSRPEQFRRLQIPRPKVNVQASQWLIGKKFSASHVHGWLPSYRWTTLSISMRLQFGFQSFAVGFLHLGFGVRGNGRKRVSRPGSYAPVPSSG